MELSEIRYNSEKSRHFSESDRTSEINLLSIQLMNSIEEYELVTVERVLYSNGNQALELVNRSCGALHITPLQIAANLQPPNGASIIQVLLKYGADTNTADKIGRTPLHYASINGYEDAVTLLLESGANPNAVYKINSWPKTIQKKSSVIGNLLPLPDGWGRTPLHSAVKAGHASIVEILIKFGANVNAADDRGVTPILLAGANAAVQGNREKAMLDYESIVQSLVNAEANVNVYNPDAVTSPLHHAANIGNAKVTQILGKAGVKLTAASCGVTPLHEAAGSGNIKVCEELLTLKDAKFFVNMTDVVGRTPLHKACFGGHRAVLELLLNHGGDLSVETTSKVTVADLVMTYIPRPLHLLLENLDTKIVHTSGGVNEVDLKICLDFTVLAPRGPLGQMNTISTLLNATNGQQASAILKHPLVETYLLIKWRKMRSFFTLLVTLHCCFVASLSLYAIVLIHPVDVLVIISRYILTCSAFLLLCHAFVQFLLVKRNYLLQHEIALNSICAVLSLAVGLSHLLFNDPQARNKVATAPTESPTTAVSNPMEHGSWELHALSIALLLAWGELMLIIGRFPNLGYYALMFARVLQNVVKVLLTFVCLIFGFALSFSIQFHTSSAFSDPWRSIVKTTVMMMGEFEYNDMFSEADNGTVPLRLPVTSRVVFLLFILLASIVLMNLMVGVAVNDIQGLQEEGHILRLAKQVHFMSELEQVLSHRFLRSWWIPKRLLVILDRIKTAPTKVILQPGRRMTTPGTCDIFCVDYLPLSLIDSIVTMALQNENPNSELLKKDNNDTVNLITMMKQMQQQLNELQALITLNKQTT